MYSVNMKLFYSIEYTDDEGDQNIKHAFMTGDEVDELMDKFIKSGVKATINRLSTLPSDVICEDEAKFPEIENTIENTKALSANKQTI
jgi:hypothetical protein